MLHKTHSKNEAFTTQYPFLDNADGFKTNYNRIIFEVRSIVLAPRTLTT